MLKKSFSKYLNEHNKENSGRASSYIRALDLISEMIQVKPFNYGNCADIWNTTSVDLLESLYQFTIIQKQKGDLSDWNFNDIPKSYLQGGFCSAALRAYQEFLVRHNYEQILVSKFENFQGEENDLPHELTQ